MAANRIFSINLNNGFYVALSTDTPEQQLAASKIRLVEIHEVMGTATPTLLLDYIDGTGVTLDAYNNPNQTYTLTYGTDSLNITTSRFKYVNNNIVGMAGGRSDLLGIRTMLFGEKWFEMYAIKHRRSWNAPYSSAIKEISTEFSDFQDIETTKESDIIIQPNMTNFEFIKWVSRVVGGDYRFITRTDGRFVFKSFGTLSQQQIYRGYILNENSFNDKDKNRSDCKNLRIKTPYMVSGDNGAWGRVAYYFDYNKKKFITEDINYSDSEQPQLSDWAYISNRHVNNQQVVDFGRNTNAPTEAMRGVLNSVNSEVEVSIQINGDFDIHAGYVVELLIPGTEAQGTLVNQSYSGKYVVKSVIHQIGMSGSVNTFITTLELVRQGINNKVEKGMVRNVL